MSDVASFVNETLFVELERRKFFQKKYSKSKCVLTSLISIFGNPLKKNGEGLALIYLAANLIKRSCKIFQASGKIEIRNNQCLTV